EVGIGKTLRVVERQRIDTILRNHISGKGRASELAVGVRSDGGKWIVDIAGRARAYSRSIAEIAATLGWRWHGIDAALVFMEKRSFPGEEKESSVLYHGPTERAAEVVIVHPR